MIPALLAVLLATPAHADPVALRAPGSGITLAAAGPAVSGAFWLGEGHTTKGAFDLGFGAEGDLRGGPVGATVAGARTLVRGPGGLGVDVTLAGSVLVPVVSPALALGATPSIFFGWRGARVDGGLGVVVPVVGRIAPDPSVRASVLAEPWIGVHAGPVSVGAGAAMGPVFTADELWAVDLRWMLSVGIEPK